LGQQCADSLAGLGSLGFRLTGSASAATDIRAIREFIIIEKRHFTRAASAAGR
jgi:hypothetical protein